jgi:hypothetical protein
MMMMMMMMMMMTMMCLCCRYGNPAQAHWRSLPLEEQLLTDVDFFDTFLDIQHLKESFPEYKVT